MASGIPPREELEQLTRVVLLRMAREHEIRGRSAMRKAELVDALAAVAPAAPAETEVQPARTTRVDPSSTLAGDPTPSDSRIDPTPDTGPTTEPTEAREGVGSTVGDLQQPEPPLRDLRVEFVAPPAIDEGRPTSSKDPEELLVEEPAPTGVRPGEIVFDVVRVARPIEDDSGPSRDREPVETRATASEPEDQDEGERPARRFVRRSIGSLYLKDDLAMPLPGAWAFALVVAYIVLNRVISDRFVLPFGASIRLYEVVLILAGCAWLTWMVVEPHPMPFGLPALTGLSLVVLVGIAPFLHGPTLDSYQANGAERGLFRMFIFVALFLTSYHIAFRLRRGLALLGIVVATTVVQAGFAIYEKLTEAPVEFLDALANSIGLVDDPLSVRPDEVGGVFTRLSGEVRAVATAPHPIVLSSVIAVGILLAGMWILYAKRTRTRVALAAAGAVMVVGLPMANSRTGFVILGLLAIPLVVLTVDRLPTMIMWALPLLFVLGFAFILNPETPRLLLNSLTDPTGDRNTVVRLERFERIPDLLEDRPFVGAGYLTHDNQIQYFDNAFNLALIELGMVGLAVVVSFFLVSLARSWASAGRASPEEAILPISGVIGTLALLAGGTTFDAWTFDQFFPTCLILIGLALGRAAVIMRRESTEVVMVVARDEVPVT